MVLQWSSGRDGVFEVRPWATCGGPLGAVGIGDGAAVRGRILVMSASARSRPRGGARRRILIVGALVLALHATRSMAEDPAAIDFFEKSVRPLIVEKCQSCHGPGKAKAGLRLTDRESLLKGETADRP